MSHSNFLRQYQIHPKTGFLPYAQPLDRLPNEYAPWEQLASIFGESLADGSFHARVSTLPTLDSAALNTEPELERAMLLLSCFAHGYVWGSTSQMDHLPESIAIPWVAVAARLDRVPSLAHASLVTHNWCMIDPEAGITADNLATRIQFNPGLVDEAWFYLVTVEVEAKGAAAIRAIAQLATNGHALSETEAQQQLLSIRWSVLAMTRSLLRMYERCDPEVFYTRIRPYIASFENIEYRGCHDNPRSYYGASAAQSALLQSMDAAFGISHDEPESKAYLLAVRRNMPPGHRALITHLEENVPIPVIIKRFPALQRDVDACIDALVAFRQAHLEMVARYVMAQNPGDGHGHTGTGGTNPMTFLKQVKKDTTS